MLAEVSESIGEIIKRISEALNDLDFEIPEKEEHDTPYIPKYKRIFLDRRLRFPHSRSRCQNDPDHIFFTLFH